MTLSPDGKWLWTGNAWVPAPPKAAPPTPMLIPILPPPPMAIKKPVNHDVPYVASWFLRGVCFTQAMFTGRNFFNPEVKSPIASVLWFVIVFTIFALVSRKVPKKYKTSVKVDVLGAVLCLIGLIVGAASFALVALSPLGF